jgi:uncharacterized protein Yka (UPF0111/DUF47 family)
MTGDTDFGAMLESKTATYLERLGACAALLPDLLDEYADSGETDDLVAEIEAIESECDERRREITAAIANADARDIGLLSTRIKFNQSALLDFYKELDVVANHTERIAQELAMIRPSPAVDSYGSLREMAGVIVEMTEVLADVGERFIRGLARSDTAETLTEGVQRIRDLESECDGLRNDVIGSAFEGDADQPLVYREFAVLFDELANTIEDLTDRMTVISSEEPGIVTEAEPED